MTYFKHLDRDLLRGEVPGRLGGDAEQQRGEVEHAVLVELRQGLAGAEPDVDSPREHLELPGVVFLLWK